MEDYNIFEIFGYKVRNRERMLSECIDDVRNRFGKYSIRPGRAMIRLTRRGADLPEIRFKTIA